MQAQNEVLFHHRDNMMTYMSGLNNALQKKGKSLHA